jgi:serine/threonine-protein kinase mTOR
MGSRDGVLVVVWALGAIAGAVSIEIKSYIADVLKIVKECLQKRGTPKPPANDEHLFGCIANLASAVGPHLLKQYNEILDLLFAGAFNEHVTAALAVVVKEIPPLLKDVQSESQLSQCWLACE